MIFKKKFGFKISSKTTNKYKLNGIFDSYLNIFICKFIGFLIHLCEFYSNWMTDIIFWKSGDISFHMPLKMQIYMNTNLIVTAKTDFLNLLYHTSLSNFNFFCTEMKKTGLSLALFPNNNICFSVSVQLNSSTCMQGQQLKFFKNLTTSMFCGGNNLRKKSKVLQMF